MDHTSLFDPFVLDLSSRLGMPGDTGADLTWPMHRRGLWLRLSVPKGRGRRLARVDREIGVGGWSVPIEDADSGAAFLRRVDAALDGAASGAVSTPR